jgi:gliding motility-associated-like protein
MIKRFFYIVFYISLFKDFVPAAGQMSMPDNVCTGQTRYYYVLPTPGSIYIWRIDGIVQQGYNTNEFAHTWSEANTFLLQVQEITFEGCPGPLRSGNVYVRPVIDSTLIIYKAFSPNGDLTNDVWNIGNVSLYPEMQITVYNRWGQSVWQSGVGYPVPWNGKSNGVDLPVDSYHYVIDLHNGTRPIIGSVTIVR